jgi:hypothetical protein
MMIRYSRFKLILFVFSFLAFGAERALAQQPTIEEAVRRIAALEERIAQLEQKVRQLEALQTRQQPANQADAGAPKWKVIANWRRLKKGMCMAEVAALLGEPGKVEAGPLTYWFWGYPSGGHVIFDGQTNKVDGWSEPQG